MIETLTVMKLFGGLVYLVLGGDLLVRGAIGLSRRTSISPMIIGLTVVAFGTSAPELLISVVSASEGHAGLAIGNVVGSNICNVLLVLGLPLLIYPTATSESPLGREATFMVLISIAFIGLCFIGPLTVIHGVVLLGLLVFGMVWSVRRAGAVPGQDEIEEELDRVLGMPNRVPMIGLYLVLGIAFLPLGADLTVDGAVAVAGWMQVEKAVIGLTIVALGTSLPELSTTLMAALHRSSGVALGNVIGSNILNLLGVMGVTALITTVPVPETVLAADVWVMLGATCALWVYAIRGIAMTRATGIVFLSAYVFYISSLYY